MFLVFSSPMWTYWLCAFCCKEFPSSPPLSQRVFLPCLLLTCHQFTVLRRWTLGICCLFICLCFHRSLLQCTLSWTLDIRLAISAVPCNGKHSETGFRQLLWLASLLLCFSAVFSQLLLHMGRGTRTAHSIHEGIYVVTYQCFTSVVVG